LHLWGRKITYELRECAHCDILKITNILGKKIYTSKIIYENGGNLKTDNGQKFEMSEMQRDSGEIKELFCTSDKQRKLKPQNRQNR
jgi:hypothetical protein